MAANILGTLVRIASLAAWIPVAWQKAATILQYQAFILLLIMGVGGFLLPKLFAQGVLDPKVLLAQSGAPLGKLSALVAMLMAGYAVEIAGVVGQFGTSATRIAYALRAGAWIWFLFLELRILKFQGDLPPYLSAARMSLYLIGASLLLPVVWPEKLLAWEHVLFISGFLRLTLSIASRVLAAHAGRLDILTLHKRKVLAYGLLIFMAMFARILADFRPDAYWAILAVASVFALSALAIWSGIFLPLRSVFPRR